MKQNTNKIIVAEELKEAMRLAPDFAARLVHKMEKFGDYSYEISCSEQLEEEVDAELRAKRARIGKEAVNILGGLNGVFKEYYGTPLFKAFVDYKNVDNKTGDEKNKTLTQMAELLTVADECCREIWADYLEAEGDEYMIRKEA